MTDPAKNLTEVKDRIRKSEKDAGREKGSVQLVTVSKVHGPDRIRSVLDAGHRVFGENRVQEALGKWPDLKVQYPDIMLHLIGPLQTNKVKDAVGLFDVIETLDRPKLAVALSKEMKKQGRRPRLFVQVNTGKEGQKSGVLPDEVDEFIQYCRQDCGLEVEGLMCIPPVGEEPALHFSLLEKIARRNGIALLSMGMSADFEKAIRFGATHVRVGSAVLGERPKP